MTAEPGAMTLHWSPNSPFVRKVVICAIERDLMECIQCIRTPVAPVRANAELLAGPNPLSKVPTLVLSDGGSLYDSRVICEYLDGIGEARPLFPSHGAARVDALRRQALGDGISDIGLQWRDAQMRNESSSTPTVRTILQKLAAAATQAERDIRSERASLDIGEIALGCALSYLDMRCAEFAWRDGRPALAAWYDQFEARPSAAATTLGVEKTP